MKLRSYTGRSIFSGLLSAPVARKRAALTETFDAFPHSRFMLIGDTGEQDMEIYAEMAAQRPEQVLAIFVRQADSENEIELEDPTGREAGEHRQTVEVYDRQARNPSRSSSRLNGAGATDGYFGTGVVTAEPEPMPGMAVPTPSSARSQTPSGSTGFQSPAERKRQELQLRVWNARLHTPPRIPLRVFRYPEECVEQADKLVKDAMAVA